MPAVSKVFNPDDRFIQDVTGVILAGGKSTRYGCNKAMVKVNGVPLVERVITVLRSLFQNLVIITNDPEPYRDFHLPLHQDLIKGLGPLGGLYTALKVIDHGAVFVVGCDMPFLNGGLIRYIASIRNNFDVVVPRIEGQFEALHALYGKGCLGPVKRFIDQKEYQVFRFFPEVSVRCVEEEEIRRFDPQLRSFSNINRPEELHQ